MEDYRTKKQFFSIKKLSIPYNAEKIDRMRPYRPTLSLP